MKEECFECGAFGEIHMHHPVPQSRGGTKVIPLCIPCHRKAHHMNGNMSIGVLSKHGASKAGQDRNKYSPTSFAEASMLVERVLADVKFSQPPKPGASLRRYFDYFDYPKFMVENGSIFPYRDGTKVHETYKPEMNYALVAPHTNSVPSGMIARHIIATATTNAIENDSKTIEFDSITAALKGLSLSSDTRNIRRFRKQLPRFRELHLIAESPVGSQRKEEKIFKRVEYGTRATKVVLEFDADFYDKRIINTETIKIPAWCINSLTKIQSALEFDLFCWMLTLSSRLDPSGAPLIITYDELLQRFDHSYHPDGTKHMRNRRRGSQKKQLNEKLSRIKASCPSANFRRIRGLGWAFDSIPPVGELLG